MERSFSQAAGLYCIPLLTLCIVANYAFAAIVLSADERPAPLRIDGIAIMIGSLAFLLFRTPKPDSLSALMFVRACFIINPDTKEDQRRQFLDRRRPADP